MDKETNEVSGVKFLLPGDMLICKSNDGGHVEFYNGFKYDVVYNDMDEPKLEDKKKSGIASITRRERLKRGYNNNGKYTNNDRAYGTFSWGNVNDEYPVQAAGDGKEKNTNYYFVYNEKTKMFELNYSSSSSAQKTYSVIWRK